MTHATVTHRLGQAWQSYWFPQTTAVRLAVIRILFVALQLLWFFEPLSNHLKYLDAPGFIQPQAAMKGLLLLFPEGMLRTTVVITTLWWVTLVAGLLAWVGLFTRMTMFTFAVGCLWLINFDYSHGMVHHPEAIFLIALFCIGLSPCGKCLSVDAWLHRRFHPREDVMNSWGVEARTTLATWPLRLAQWLLVIAYFEAFLSKATTGGLSWMNGYTLQNYLLMDGVRWERPLGMFLCRFRWLCVFLAAGTMLLEATFWLVMLDRIRLIRRLMPLYFLAGIGLHVGIFILQAAPFWQFIALYLTWIPFEKLQRAATQRVTMPPQPVAALISSEA